MMLQSRPLTQLLLSGLIPGLILMGLAACSLSASNARPEAPRLTLKSLQWDPATNQLTVHIHLRHGVDGTLPVGAVRLDMRLGGDLLLQTRRDITFDLRPFATETVELRAQPASRDAIERLNALSRGEITSIGYQLKGNVITPRGKDYFIEAEARLRQIPGTENRFR